MKKSGSQLFLFLSMTMLLCIPSLLFAGSDIERTFTLARDGKVYLEVKSGDVSVSSWNRNELKFVAHQDTIGDVSNVEGNIRIIVKRSSSSHCELTIPDKAQLRIETVSGDVRARDIGGFADVRTTSGDIEIVRTKNGVRCKSVNGDIRVEEVTGNADLRTTSGKIRVEGIRGSVEAHTVSGKIEIESFSRGDEAELESISGNITLHGELAPGGVYRADSHSGSIKIGIPRGSGFELQADTFSGRVDCDFDLRATGGIDRRKTRGVVGKDGARLILSTFSGNINITKR